MAADTSRSRSHKRPWPWRLLRALVRGIPEHYSFRTRVRMILQFSRIGAAWEVFQTLFAVLVSALYVYQTYYPGMEVVRFDSIALGVFGVDYALNLYSCENRLDFIFSFMGMMDAISIFPSLADQVRQGNHKSSSLPFIRFVRVLRLLRLMRLVRAAGTRSVSAVQKQIYTILLLITCIVFIAAGMFHAVENDSETRPDIWFGDALYYVIVTIATVGYGDITPHTSAGRAVAVTVIVISFTVIPRELSRLNQLIAMQSQFRKTYQSDVGNPHILVVGYVTDPRCLLNFFREFYHPDRIFISKSGMRSPRQSPCVVVGPHEPSEEIINLLDHPVLQHRVSYIKGSVMSEEDLCRVGADSARACFILVSKMSTDQQQADAETILRLLAIRNYNPELEIFSQIVCPTYLSYISDASMDHLLCLKQIKLGLMAKSCLYPGFSTLICNMCRSAAVAKREKFGGWQQEYIEGMSLEVYSTTLPRQFHGLTFSQASELLYQCSQGDVILLGVYESSDSSRGHKSPPSSPSSKLPQLRVSPQIPLDTHSGRFGAADRMLTNPGSTLAMREGHIVYVLSDNKKLTLESTISGRLKDWVNAGNSIPDAGVVVIAKLSRAKSIDKLESDSEKHKPSPLATILNTASVHVEEHQLPAAAEHVGVERRKSHQATRQVVIDTAVDPTTDEPLRNHVLIVSELDLHSIIAFTSMLRRSRRQTASGRRKSPSSRHQPILFLSWSAPANLPALTQALAPLQEVFIMLAVGDSKSEFLRANILHASRCVLLTDKSAVQDIDGGIVDSHIILHYLAVLSIQVECRTASFHLSPRCQRLRPIVQLSIPRTVHILDTELRKRTMEGLGQPPTPKRRFPGTTVTTADSPTEFSRVGSLGKRQQWLEAYKKKSSISSLRESIYKLDMSIRSRKLMQNRMSTIRKEQDTSRRRYFDFRGPTTLPFYAAGYAFSDDIFDNLLCQSYFTPGLIRFIYELLFSENGRPSGHTNAGFGNVAALAVNTTADYANCPTDSNEDSSDQFDADGSSSAHDEDDGAIDCPVVSSLEQIPVPPAFIGSTFGELFVDLASKGNIVAVGLYRSSARGEARLPYVATGPKKDTVLHEDDLVFALVQPNAWRRYADITGAKHFEPHTEHHQDE